MGTHNYNSKLFQHFWAGATGAIGVNVMKMVNVHGSEDVSLQSQAQKNVLVMNGKSEYVMHFQSMVRKYLT